MRRKHATRGGLRALLLAQALGVVAAPCPAAASDGVIEINQTRMAAGGITPGDTAGAPATLSQPGSYRLTSDLVVTGIHDAVIHVKTGAGVTIDLNGFAIRGPYSCAPGACTPGGVGYGVLLGSGSEGDQVTVRNGRITGLSGACILLGAEARIENVDVSSCGEGIVVGARSHVVDTRIVRTLYRGLRFTGASALFERNVLAQNGLGAVAGQTASVEGGTATGGNLCEDGLCRANLARRRYYLTKPRFLPTEAPTACATGFHFASFWELHEPARLDYDTNLGLFIPVAQGSGPPAGPVSHSNYSGWVRTGTLSDSPSAPPGQASCMFWSDASPFNQGTVIALPDGISTSWATAASNGSPWAAGVTPCNAMRPVWCVED